MPNNQSKTALVTGATHGIGRALAENLLSDGWTVYGTGRDGEALECIQQKHPNFKPIQADFTKNEDIEQVANVIKASGIELNLNIQNAGMKSTPRPLHDYTVESIDEVMQVNLLAPMKLAALLTNNMASQSRLLFVTSRAATLNLKEGSTYCASKAGLDSIANILRQELVEKNIAVASVIPGEVDTRIQELLRNTKTFHQHGLFQMAYDNGQLITPETCATFLKWLLVELPHTQFSQLEIPASIYDHWHHKYWLNDTQKLPEFPFVVVKTGK